MDENTLQRVFDPFFTGKPPGEGTGLGLYICHNLIERMGGRIEVESELHKGSAFKILIPVEDVEKIASSREA
jgi:signal transduction histidine kinase